MTCLKTPLLVTLLFILSSISNAQKTEALPRSIPEAESVSSEGIAAFLDAAAKSKHEFHSLVFLRHGKVVAEGWWNPYRADLKHTMYSTSKSFTATAIGFAVSEKLLTVNDKVISFFPNDLPDTISPFLAALSVKDVLSMTDGQEPDPTFSTVVRDSNWVKTFLATPIVHQPGTKFLYNTLGTYMLSAIVQKVTGQKEIDYLRPRLFDPLGITGMDWEIDPKGINTGGWGLRIKTEDMAKFGQLFLQKGMWKGEQILPAAWVEEATSVKIIQNPDSSQAKRDSSDWDQGYCYQMWRCRHNGFRADGAFGQFIIVMPDKDAVIAITAETADMQDEINLAWKYLLPSIQEGKLPEDKNIQLKLKRELASLALPLAAKSASPVTTSINGKAFTIEPNGQHIAQIKFNFEHNICKVDLKTANGSYQLSFGSGEWKLGETTMHGPNLLTNAKANLVGLPAFKIAGSYSWKDEHTLELVLRYIESPHTEKMTVHFEDNKASIDIQNSFDYGSKKTTLTGSVKQ